MSRLEIYKKLKNANNPAYDKLLGIYKHWIKEQRVLVEDDKSIRYHVRRERKTENKNKYS